MKQKKRQRFLALVMLMVFAMSSGAFMVSPAEASPSGGLVKITDFTGGNGGGANQAETIYYGSFYQNKAEGYTPPEGGEAFNKNNYEQKGIQWRVLANDTTGSGTKQVFLLSDKALFAHRSGAATDNVTWKDSEIRKVLNGDGGVVTPTIFYEKEIYYENEAEAKAAGKKIGDVMKKIGDVKAWGSFAGDAFSDREHAAIKDTENSDVTATDKLFFLGKGEAKNAAHGFSTDEAADSARVADPTELAQYAKGMYGNVIEEHDGVSENPASWVLRSNEGFNFDAIDSNGSIFCKNVESISSAARPAFNLDQSKIAFLSAAEGGKNADDCAGAFGLDTSYSGYAGWKVTLKDPYDANTNTGIKTPTGECRAWCADFDINKMARNALDEGVKLLNIGGAAQASGRTYFIKYSGVTTGKNMFVSALLDPDNLGNYAKLASVGTEASKEGLLAVNLGNVSGEKFVKIFGEQENGDYMTDYMSDLSEAAPLEGAPGMNGPNQVLSHAEYGKAGLTLNLFGNGYITFESGEDKEYNTNIIVDTNNATTIGTTGCSDSEATDKDRKIKFTGDFTLGGKLEVWSYAAQGEDRSYVTFAGNLNFILDEHKSGDTFIDMAGKDEADLTDAKLHFIQTQDNKLAIGEKMTLINSARNYTGASEIKTTGGLKKYLYSVKIEEVFNPISGATLNSLMLCYLGAVTSGQTKTFTQARLGNLAAINGAGDIVATSLMDSAIPQSKKWEAFAVLGGNRTKYDRDNNNLDINVFNVAAGVSGKVTDNLTLGVFAEGGDGRYYTENKFTDCDVLAKGDINYFGGGLFAKAEGKKTDLGQLHGEASVRVGHINSKYNSDTFNPDAYTSFDMSGTYFGAHAGFGYRWNMKSGSNIDTYVKYLWNRQNSVSATLDDGTVELDALNSHRLRTGFRYNTKEGKTGFNFFGGLAYEYEFDGKANGNVDGSAIETSDIKGGSGLAELGVKFEKDECPWKGEIALQGFTGQRAGFGANLSVWYMFGK